MELPGLFNLGTWDVGFNSTEVVFVEDEGILFFLSHDVENFVFDISLYKIFQNFKIVFDDNCVSVFQVDSIHLVGERAHVEDFINVERCLMFRAGLVFLGLLFLT